MADCPVLYEYGSPTVVLTATPALEPLALAHPIDTFTVPVEFAESRTSNVKSPATDTKYSPPLDAVVAGDEPGEAKTAPTGCVLPTDVPSNVTVPDHAGDVEGSSVTAHDPYPATEMVAGDEPAVEETVDSVVGPAVVDCACADAATGANHRSPKSSAQM